MFIEHPFFIFALWIHVINYNLIDPNTAIDFKSLFNVIKQFVCDNILQTIFIWEIYYTLQTLKNYFFVFLKRCDFSRSLILYKRSNLFSVDKIFVIVKKTFFKWLKEEVYKYKKWFFPDIK